MDTLDSHVLLLIMSRLNIADILHLTSVNRYLHSMRQIEVVETLIYSDKINREVAILDRNRPFVVERSPNSSATACVANIGLIPLRFYGKIRRNMTELIDMKKYRLVANLIVANRQRRETATLVATTRQKHDFFTEDIFLEYGTNSLLNKLRTTINDEQKTQERDALIDTILHI